MGWFRGGACSPGVDLSHGVGPDFVVNDNPTKC